MWLSSHHRSVDVTSCVTIDEDNMSRTSGLENDSTCFSFISSSIDVSSERLHLNCCRNTRSHTENSDGYGYFNMDVITQSENKECTSSSDMDTIVNTPSVILSDVRLNGSKLCGECRKQSNGVKRIIKSKTARFAFSCLLVLCLLNETIAATTDFPFPDTKQGE